MLKIVEDGDNLGNFPGVEPPNLWLEGVTWKTFQTSFQSFLGECLVIISWKMGTNLRTFSWCDPKTRSGSGYLYHTLFRFYITYIIQVWGKLPLGQLVLWQLLLGQLLISPSKWTKGNPWSGQWGKANSNNNRQFNQTLTTNSSN